jgi:hypothetical protein
MKKVNKCVVENCIPTPSSCVEWNGGSIEYLGICDGDSLNTLMWEIITKLQEIAGENLEDFDIDALLDICNQQAPTEVTIISILNLIKNNQVCLKDFIDTLNERLNEILEGQGVNVNLKCYAEFDNQGNSLSITRDQLDQLVIDNLCAQLLRIQTVEGKIINLQSQIDNLSNTQTVDELSFATCVDAGVKPTSQQVIAVAQAFCDLRTSTGTVANISTALALTPGDLNAEFGLITGWILIPQNWAQNYGNLLLEVENLRQRIIFMEENCCAATCEDVGIGFSVVYNEDGDGVILRFTSGSGTKIPTGFEDLGSTGTITDIDGNQVEFDLEIENNAEVEVIVSTLNLEGDLTINVTGRIGTEALTCEKCFTRVIKANSRCAFCTVTNTGDTDIVLIYDDASMLFVNPTIPTTSTSTSTTTTTTTTSGS